jgi:hypothetical protein
MSESAPTRVVDDFTATGEVAMEAIRDVMEWNAPWLVKAPIAIVVGLARFTIALGTALAGLGIALIAVGFAGTTIFHTWHSGFDLLNQVIDFSQQNLSGWQLLSAMGALAVGFVALGFKGKKSLYWVTYIYDWVLWHTGKGTEPPEIAALKRSAAAHGFRLVPLAHD